MMRSVERAVGPCVSGMSFTYQGGASGAAAAAARVLDLDDDTTLAALGLACNMASGNQQALHEGSISVRVYVARGGHPDRRHGRSHGCAGHQ